MKWTSTQVIVHCAQLDQQTQGNPTTNLRDCCPPHLLIKKHCYLVGCVVKPGSPNPSNPGGPGGDSQLSSSGDDLLARFQQCGGDHHRQNDPTSAIVKTSTKCGGYCWGERACVTNLFKRFEMVWISWVSSSLRQDIHQHNLSGLLPSGRPWC